MTANGHAANETSQRHLTRWLVFLVVFLAVAAYVSWHGGESAQWARSFLRHLLRALF